MRTALSRQNMVNNDDFESGFLYCICIVLGNWPMSFWSNINTMRQIYTSFSHCLDISFWSNVASKCIFYLFCGCLLVMLSTFYVMLKPKNGLDLLTRLMRNEGALWPKIPNFILGITNHRKFVNLLVVIYTYLDIVHCSIVSHEFLERSMVYSPRDLSSHLSRMVF